MGVAGLSMGVAGLSMGVAGLSMGVAGLSMGVAGLSGCSNYGLSGLSSNDSTLEEDLVVKIRQE